MAGDWSHTDLRTGFEPIRCLEHRFLHWLRASACAITLQRMSAEGFEPSSGYPHVIQNGQNGIEPHITINAQFALGELNPYIEDSYSPSYVNASTDRAIQVDPEAPANEHPRIGAMTEQYVQV